MPALFFGGGNFFGDVIPFLPPLLTDLDFLSPISLRSIRFEGRDGWIFSSSEPNEFILSWESYFLILWLRFRDWFYLRIFPSKEFYSFFVELLPEI